MYFSLEADIGVPSSCTISPSPGYGRRVREGLGDRNRRGATICNNIKDRLYLFVLDSGNTRGSGLFATYILRIIV